MAIRNAGDYPLNLSQGSVPNVGGAMNSWFQRMTFGVVTKTIENYQAVENVVSIVFQGVWQPFSARQLMMKPEGQRAWSWYMVHADPSLQLEVDSTITYLQKQYRVMQKTDYTLYGYIQYEIIEDYTGAGPTEVIP